MVPIRDHAWRWGAYAAVGIAALSAFVIVGWLSYPRFPNEPTRDGSRAPRQAFQTGGEVCGPDRLRSLPNNAQGAATRARCDEAEHEERRNLDAASEARYASDIARQSLAVSEYQGWAFFWQALATVAAFIAAAVAVVFAKSAADAANKTLKHEQWSAERELRAYVFVNVTRLKTKQSGITGQWDMWVRMEFGNTGKTPANNVRIAVRAIQIPKDTSFDLTKRGEVILIGPLGPKDYRMRDVPIQIVSDNPVRDNEKGWRVHLFGRIDYGDEFSPDRWTTFHAHIDNAAKGRTLHTADTGNDYR